MSLPAKLPQPEFRHRAAAWLGPPLPGNRRWTSTKGVACSLATGLSSGIRLPCMPCARCVSLRRWVRCVMPYHDSCQEVDGTTQSLNEEPLDAPNLVWIDGASLGPGTRSKDRRATSVGNVLFINHELPGVSFVPNGRYSLELAGFHLEGVNWLQAVRHSLQRAKGFSRVYR